MKKQPTSSNIIKGGLRSLAASFPGFASFGQAWSEYENYKTGERVAELMEGLRTKFESLKDKVENIEQICQEICEEFPSLLEIAIDKVRKEFSQDKRRIYADVLANLLLRQHDMPYDNKVAVFHSLDVLTSKDLEVLKLFRGREESAAKNLDWQSISLQGQDDNHKLAELMSMLAKLESRGLIITTRIHSGVVYVADGLDQSIARLSETKYRILPLGQLILLALE